MMRSVYTCLIVLFCIVPVQLLQAADGGTDTHGARFTQNGNKKNGGRYVHAWQGSSMATEELEAVLREINAVHAVNNLPDLHLVIGGVGKRGRHMLLDAASVDPRKPLTKKELLSQQEDIKRRTQAFNEWVRTQVDGNKMLVVQLNVIAEQTWTDGVLTSKYVFEPFFTCPLRNNKAIIADVRVSLIIQELKFFAHGANVTDQESFNTEVTKLLKRIEGDLLGKIRPETKFVLNNSIPYSQIQDKPWFKDMRKRIETGTPKEDTALTSTASRVYDLSDILTNTEKTSLNLLLDYLNEKLKGGMDLKLDGKLASLVRKLEEIELLITDFRMPSEQLQAIENWMAEYAAKAVIWMHFDEDRLMYEFRAGTNRLLNEVCALEKAGVFIANIKANQLVYDITSLYAATVNYFVPGKVTPLPPDYVAKNPFFQWVSQITVPSIPETWYNPDAGDYNGIYADYLLNNDWNKFRRIPLNALEELLTGVKWPSNIDTRKYSVDRQHFALLCGFLNILPDALNGALGLPKAAISINELLCNPDQMEQVVNILEHLSQQARDAGGYGKWFGELIDDIHINPCMASYYAGNICGTMLVSYAAIMKLGKITSLAAFITELGNLDPAGMVMGMVLSPVGRFARFAVEKAIGLWRLGKYIGKFVYQNGRYVFRLARMEGKKLMEELKNVEWRAVKDIFQPSDWMVVEGPDGEPLQIAYFIEGNGDGGGGDKKPGKVIQLFPDKNPDGSIPDEQIAIVENEKGEQNAGIVENNDNVIPFGRRMQWVEAAAESRHAMGSLEPEITIVLMRNGNKEGVLNRRLAKEAGHPIIRYDFTDVKGRQIGDIGFIVEQIDGRNTLLGIPHYADGAKAELPGVVGVALEELEALLKANPHALSEKAGIDQILFVVDEDMMRIRDFRKESDFLKNTSDKKGPISERLKEGYRRGEVRPGNRAGGEHWLYKRVQTGKKVRIGENERLLMASKAEASVQASLKTDEGEVLGVLDRQLYQNNKASYTYRSNALPASSDPDVNVQYFNPTDAGALPNRGEGSLRVILDFRNPGIRGEEVIELEPEILDNILALFSGKKADHLFLYWRESPNEFRKAQEELVTRVLTEKHGYNKPETRSVADKEYLVFSRPPAAPDPVKRVDLGNMGLTGSTEFFLQNGKNERVLKVVKASVPDNGNAISFSYTDLRIGDQIADEHIPFGRYNTYVFSHPKYDLSPLGINKRINVMNIGVDAMPARLEQELPGTMREVRNEAFAYYHKNFNAVEGVMVELKTIDDGVQSYDLMVYEGVINKEGNMEDAIRAMPTAQWAAREKGLTQAIIVGYHPNPNPDRRFPYVLFTDAETAGGHGFSIDGSGGGGKSNIAPDNTGSSADGLAPDRNGFTNDAPVGSPEKEVRLLLADGSGEIVRKRIDDGRANPCTYRFRPKQAGNVLFPEDDRALSLAATQIEFKYDAVKEGDNKFLAIKYYPSDKVEKLRVTVLKEALAYYRSENITGIKIMADNWTAEVTDLEILQSDIGKVISKDYPVITIEKDGSTPTVVIFSKGSLKPRTEIAVADLPEVLTAGSYGLSVNSKGSNVMIGVLHIKHTEKGVRSFVYSFNDAVSGKYYQDIGSAAIWRSSEGQLILNFQFSIHPALGHIVIEPHLFDKAFTHLADGAAFNEVKISWANGFADANDAKAFQKALPNGVESAIFETEVGKVALKNGYTDAVVEVKDGRILHVSFRKPAQAN